MTMAYMNQEKKAAIAAELKKVVPAGWKYSLSVRHHSTIVMVVRSAPVDVLGKIVWFDEKPQSYATINEYHYRRHITCDELCGQIEKIIACLNLGNWNNSDSQSDYFDIGHGIELKFGSWDKPFVNSSVTAGV
jgi:hypothetical protein